MVTQELMQAKVRELEREAAALQIEHEARALQKEEVAERRARSGRSPWPMVPSFVVRAFRGAPVS